MHPMRHLVRPAILALFAAAMAVPAAAQSDILLRLRSGSPLGDRFRVDSAGGVVAIGQLGIGIIPASGCGYRMMWHPFKGAFRAGTTDDGGSCNSWDDANVGFYSWAGGNLTRATAFATFAFGDQVNVTAVSATGFGSGNTVSGTAGFAGGALNRCTAAYCTAFGFTANAGGQGAVAIGYRVTADANYSVAIGHRASTNGMAGAFVIADQSTTDSLEASTTNQFNSRYAGGYRLYTNATKTTGVSLNAGGSSWNVISDVNRKEHFLEIDGEDILARIRNLPVTTWRYIDEENRAVRHIGPMAQDWERAFGFSGDTTTINTGDFDGVNLAGIQALERRTAELREQVAERDRRIESLEERIARLEALVAAQAQRQP
jgi:hypothetical protein